MNENESKNEKLYTKANFFKEKNILVHITVGTPSIKFYNGNLIEVNQNFIILNDEKLGSMPIFFSDMLEIEPREEKR